MKNDFLIFSIDPGVVNIGVCWFNATKNKILFADKVQIAPRMKDVKNESEIIPRIYKLFFIGKIYEMIKVSNVVLIEQQMKRKFLLFQYSLGAILFEKNIDYVFQSPRSIKTQYSIGKTARKKAGKSVKGVKNNHAANKKAGIDLISKLYPKFMNKVNLKKRDDIADAVLQARYYTEKHKIYKDIKNDTNS
jgi:hypothetical protein